MVGFPWQPCYYQFIAAGSVVQMIVVWQARLGGLRCVMRAIVLVNERIYLEISALIR